MTVLRNIWLVFSSLVILAAAYVIIFTDIGPFLVLALLFSAVLIYAIKQFILYFSLAKNMVGGKTILLKGIIALDFAIFMFSLNNINIIYIMIFFVIMHIITGAIDIFRALEIKKLSDKSWKIKAFFGALNIAIAGLCIVFIQSYTILCIIYGGGLVITAGRRISGIFKKRKIVYIQ